MAVPYEYCEMVYNLGPSIQDVGKFLLFLTPYPPPLAVFLLLSIGKFDPFSPTDCRRLKWTVPFCSIILMVAEIKKKIGARKYWKATYRTSHDNMVEPFYCFVVDL